jgi:outer membrane protein insertion porin family
MENLLPAFGNQSSHPIVKTAFANAPVFVTPLKFTKRRVRLNELPQSETLEPIQQDQLEANYRYRIQSIETSFGKELNLKSKLYVGIVWFGERYAFSHGERLMGAPEKFNTTKLIGKVGYDYDALVPYYYFNSGWKNQLIFAHVRGKTITNNNTFYSIENQTTYFKRIKAMGNLALRVKLGYAKNIDTPFPPFAIDNNRNVRGSGNLVQRGSALWVINNEYRQSLFERKWFAMQANLFVDVSGIRPSGYALKDLFKNENAYAYSGIGIRFIHKYIYNAVFRIDYGFSLGKVDQQGIVFGIGQYF